jgi:hypothetical protein
MEPFETYEHAGVKVELHYDECGEHANPRECDNVTTLVCWHPDYILGDYQISGSRGAVETVFETARGRTEFPSMRAIHRYITLMLGGRRVTPLYLYDHSGISIRAGSPSPFDNPTVCRDEFGQGMGWDTSMVGFAFCTDERITELCGEDEQYHTDEWIDKAIAGDVETYDLYLTGQVYGYVVAPDTEDEESCWGFLGDDCIKQEANAVAADVAVVRAERERLRRIFLFAPETMVRT